MSAETREGREALRWDMDRTVKAGRGARATATTGSYEPKQREFKVQSGRKAPERFARRGGRQGANVYSVGRGL